MTIPVVTLPPGNQWDQNMVDRLLEGTLYPHGLEFERLDGWPNEGGCILIIPGRYWFDRTDLINEMASHYDWILGLRAGDEEDRFDIRKVNHPNIKWWVQTPRLGSDYGEARLFGVGFPPHFNNMGEEPPAKLIPLFLAAQLTHERREQAFAALEGYVGHIQPTPGFTQGMQPDDYADYMCKSRVAPAPSGPVAADTFRLFEALEAHCVPIADDYAPATHTLGYWSLLFPDHPFPLVWDYEELPDLVDESQAGWPANTNRIAAWWMREKRKMAQWLKADLVSLGAL